MYSIYNNNQGLCCDWTERTERSGRGKHPQTVYQVPQTLRDTVPAEPGKRIEGHLPKIFDHVCKCDEIKYETPF